MSEQERDPLAQEPVPESEANAEELTASEVSAASQEDLPADEHEHAEHEHDVLAEDAASPDPMETKEMLHVDFFEATWMRITAVVIAVFFIAVVISAFAVGFQLPGVYERIDPTTLYDEGSPWADPGLRELAPGKYELYIRAQIWSFTPNMVRVPAGSEVTFYVTSADVQHGFKLQDTNVNMMVLPGQINTLTAKFENPGTYDFVCHEYCGQLHHTMYGQLIVEPEQVAETEGGTD
ncbi:MAG: cytochrome c oxidase subunit II [Caldilineaceae bacterium]|jgi:cytochrome c oxidase subunit 2